MFPENRRSLSGARARGPVPVLLIALLAAAALVAAPPARAAQPFGLFGIYGGGNAGSGIIPINGWALDDDGVESVDILVDGTPDGRAFYGHSRPDVARVHPGYPDGDHSGFGYQLDSTRYLNGVHLIGAEVTSKTGERRALHSFLAQFHNDTQELRPFGAVELPLPNAELYGRCNDLTPRRLAVVRGWSLDAGVERSDTGIGYVELLLDGNILARSTVDCGYDPDLGGWTNCYGLRRLDVEAAFPTLFNAPHAGFRFVLDVGELIAHGGVREGLHRLGVRVGDVAGQVSELPPVPVTFLCDGSAPNTQAAGVIDLPPDGLFFGGVVTLTGYAVDYEGVDQVLVYVDGNFQGEATYGLPRPSVSADFPGYPGSAHAGWSFALDTRPLVDGQHELQVIVVDDDGFTTLIGERRFATNN